MANIQINDLHSVENEFEELSNLELEIVVGGKRHVSYEDRNNDGILDKVVTDGCGHLIKIKYGHCHC